MTFQEVLKEMLEQEADTNYFPQGIAMAKQIEANRIAIEKLREEVRSLDRRTVGMVRLGPRT